MKRDNADLRAEKFVLAVVVMLFLMIILSQHIYDVPTALFFTLALALLQREKWSAYAWLFPFVCLNRETAILLTLLFGVYFFTRMDRRLYLWHLGYQLVVYLVIRIALMSIFADVPGSPLYFRLAENLQLYANEPVATNMFLLFVVMVLCIVAARWRQAPGLMRTAFLLFAPILTLLYLIAGVSFEVRVFVELLPVVAIIGSS
jgi:hypothetical protein